MGHRIEVRRAGRARRARIAVVAVVVVVVAFAIGAGSAQAAQQVISTPGPLDHIYLNDNLQCNATHTGDTSPEFFSSTSSGSCGTMIATGGTAYGFRGGNGFTPVSQSGVTGSGTSSDPYKVVTVVAAGTTGLRVTQTDTYVTGQEQYRSDIAVFNSTAQTLTATVYHAGDCYLQNSDVGYGYFDPVGQGIYCTANANNSPAGRLLGFRPLSRGSSYVEGRYSAVYSDIVASGAQFPNTCDCTISEDNGAGLSWAATVRPRQTSTISLVTTFSPSGALPPAASTDTPTVQGSAAAGFSGSVSPNGQPTTAHFEYGLDPKYSGGGDTVFDHQTPDQTLPADFGSHPISATVSGLVPNAVYHVRVVATNSTGTTQSDDQIFTTGSDPAPPPPVLGKMVDATLVSGVVLIKLPGAHTAADAALAKGTGFIPLTEARQLPTGTQVDSRLGSLRLIAAAAASQHIGKTQSATLGGGLFKVTQARSGIVKGLTTFSLLEGDFPGAPTYASCPGHAAPDGFGPTAFAAISRRVLQTLHARDSHGRFRTRGRYSAGTVRGTVWDTVDRCDGTLTIVKRGTVDVTDFHLRRTIRVHAGHRYLARAPGKHK